VSTLTNLRLDQKSKFGFDFDQTIADSSAGITQCIEVVAKAFNSRISKEEIINLSKSGMSLSETLSVFVPNHEIDSAVRIFMESYPVLGVQGTSLFPGVHELFSQLRNLNIPIYIISAKSFKNLQLSIDYLQIQVEEYFGGMNLQGKADKIEYLGLDFYVGDQVSDMQAASLAGAKGLLVNNSSKSLESKETCFAEFSNILELNQKLSSVLEI
jgi:phosphoglycolate phosphatase-like HAD superfamily hydrolase